MLLKQAFAPLVDLIYPPRCPLCGDAIAAQDGLCQDCWATLEIPAEPACPQCQQSVERAGEVCANCTAHPPPHDGIATATYYNDTARQLVLSFKHGRKIALAKMMARQMAARIGVLEGAWLAVPVPLHRVRLWQRGFNQSALIAKELCRHIDAQLCVDALVRRKQTPSLGGLGRVDRAKALDGAIRANHTRAAKLQGAQVMLVDDVLTSGATSDACARALKDAGVRTVRIACFSRVPDHRW